MEPRRVPTSGLVARAQAILKRRAYVTPDDVKSMAGDVLGHRMVLSYGANAEVSADEIVGRILSAVPAVP